MSTPNVLVGTASWTDRTLIESGQFYPPGIKTAEARLRFYAENFSIVEVDSTYYALPSTQTATAWVQRTPERFTFNIKAFRLLTKHQTEPKFLPPQVREALGSWDKKTIYYDDLPTELTEEVWREFTTALDPLLSAGKLGAFLFQFPRWFVKSRSTCDHIRMIRDRLPNYELAVEFRHESWFGNEHRRESTLDFLRELNVCNVTVDEPQTSSGSIPTVWDVTYSGLAMFRLHGRNLRTWNERRLSSASERFDYDYAEEELATFVRPILETASRVSVVHVIFNVNMRDQGVRGARTMQHLLDDAVPGTSPPL